MLRMFHQQALLLLTTAKKILVVNKDKDFIDTENKSMSEEAFSSFELP